MPIRPPRSWREGGYALVAAVTSVAAFAYVAFQVLAANEGAVGVVAARVNQAKLSAAADAGMYLAIHALASEDRGSRWSIDGRPHSLEFADVDLIVSVEDERGKAPLAGLNDAQARALFAGAGARGERLDALVAEFREWQTEDATLPGSGAAASPPATPVRHGQFRTIGEMAGLKDMDPGLLARIAPAVTVFFEENGPFSPQNATPLALQTMRADVQEDADQGEGRHGADAPPQQPSEELAPDDHLIGHPVTIRVTATDRGGSRTHRMAIVELSGDTQKPYWVRYVE